MTSGDGQAGGRDNDGGGGDSGTTDTGSSIASPAAGCSAAAGLYP